ncbi:MAG: hypothetical protein AMS21_13035 [Gemmatimonas sp. SG8_38_2]|nr:MAG: hypothetical protein AMS21_13035 [Gemmatimonas sp. SG8_38_2]
MRNLAHRPGAAHENSPISVLLLLTLLCLGCDGPTALTVDMPLHLEEHLEVAEIEGSEVPADPDQPLEWLFDTPQPEWKPLKLTLESVEAVTPIPGEDALRLSVDEESRVPNTSRLVGAVYVELPGLTFDDWGFVEVRARTGDPVFSVVLGFNYTEDDGAQPGVPLYSLGSDAPVITDGTIQTYRLPLYTRALRMWDGPWTHLAIGFQSRQDVDQMTLDLLSVRVVPREHEYAEEGTGVREVRAGSYAGFEPTRRTHFMHAPGKVAYRVTIPEDGRLDVALGVLRDDAPVTFSVTATLRDGTVEKLMEEAYTDREVWGQRSVDMAHLAGETVTLALSAESERAGTVALWGAPTLSSSRAGQKPNVIFYVIDGAGADYMSLYGYNRRTTPNLERLAAEGAVFEHAHSNSSWTRPSTASFMTSLQHSVMGGARRGFNVVPEEVATMAQHMHRAGYQTSVLVANPNAGRMSGLEREVDCFREDWEAFAYGGGERGNRRESSRYLHEAFFNWRDEYPGEPYWVHFQTVDIHSNEPAAAPFSGLFVGPQQLKAWEEWKDSLSSYGIWTGSWEATGISRVAFWSVMQGLYDETMAYNDYQIGRLVERLKAEGEWENTLLIVGSDHSIRAAMGDMALAVQDSLPPRGMSLYPMFRPSISRIPLMFVWPGHIEGGLRFYEPVVSMIDVLPTILDLLNLPKPEVMMGQSLAPLLLGTGGWEPRPVILDQFGFDSEAGVYRGVIEVIDGRWGASLEINADHPEEEKDEPQARWWRPVPLLLYDLWNDPYCLHSLHEERPDLVEKYTEFLEKQWEAHQALAQRFTAGEQVELTPEQLETLRALGYIQ